MSFLDYVDYALAFGQGVFAILLWHRAEPRMLEARGRTASNCTLLLGFVLASSVALSLSRPMVGDDPYDSWRSTRDAILLLYAACMYRRAMKVLPKPA